MGPKKRFKLPWRSAIGIALAIWVTAMAASGGAGANTSPRPAPQPFGEDEAHPVWAPGGEMARNPDGTIMMVRSGPPAIPPEVTGPAS